MLPSGCKVHLFAAFELMNKAKRHKSVVASLFICALLVRLRKKNVSDANLRKFCQKSKE